jgi:hypothetical protein
MALKVSDLTGGVVAPGGSYPYGNVQNDPGGTLVDVKMMADMIQFFQRLMDEPSVNITPNSLPENSSNGYQLLQALNMLIGRRDNALAYPFGAGGLQAVSLVGLAITGGPTFTMGEGFFYYNGEMVYLPGNTYTIPFGDDLYIAITHNDGMAIGTATNILIGTPDIAAYFLFSNMITWKNAVGIDAINTTLGLLVTKTTAGPWVPLGTGGSSIAANWRGNAGGLIPVLFISAGLSEIICEGQLQTTANASGSSLIATLPVAPTLTNKIFPCSAVDPAGNPFTFQIGINNSGQIYFANPNEQALVNAANWSIFIDPIRFLTI